MSLNTATYNELVTNMNIEWLKAQAALPLTAEQSGIFRVGTWEAHTGNSKRYQEFDVEQYAYNKDEDDIYTDLKNQIGYYKDMTPVNRGAQVKFTREILRRNKYPDVLSRAKELGTSINNRRELDMQHRLTFGAATSYTDRDGKTIDLTTGDGFQLFYTAHTLAGSSTTYRNRLVGNPQFSKGSLELMEKTALENSYNNLGEKVDYNLDIIWSTDDPNTVNSIREQLQATAEVSSPNEGIPNVYRGKYRHVILNRVATTATGAPDNTKARYWGLSSSSNTQMYMDIEERTDVIDPTQEDDTGSYTFKAYGSYSICAVSGRGNFFSSGDATA